MVKVFHNRRAFDYNFCSQHFFMDEKGLADAIGKQPITDFELVAKIDTHDLNKVFELTNSIDCAWYDNELIKVAFNKDENVSKDEQTNRKRSTSISDVFEHNGKFYAVATCGFVEIKRDKNEKGSEKNL